MSADTLVYDMASMTEGSPQIFVKKDWLSILDNQNGNYSGNQSVIDTSQLANSNKYMSYREAYLAIPMVLTASGTADNVAVITPATAGSSADMAFGLKNWWGSIIHSITLDLAGTTIIQQTPFCSLWNCFKLMTTLSFQDVLTNGSSMGFYPDDPLAWGFKSSASSSELGTFNNRDLPITTALSGAFATGGQYGNAGFLARQKYIAFDPASVSGTALAGNDGLAISTIFDSASADSLYKSYISTRTNAGVGVKAVIQYSIMATLQLKHIHPFFQNVPLLKGVFFKLTLNLNQSSLTATVASNAITGVSVSSPLGGVSPIMIASSDAPAPLSEATLGGTIPAGLTISSASSSQFRNGSAGAWTADGSVLVSIAVGNKPILSQQQSYTSSGLPSAITLNIPAYTFNPVYESAYLSSPVKTIVYEDIYQYQVLNVGAGATFNNLITNGIANIKSVLVIPFFTASENATLEPYQSPFDDCGGGTTSPLALLTNFNVVVAGQNMIYNTQKYSYQMFMEQVQGVNAVNGDLSDGLTSSLISHQGWEQKQCYYYVNCSRMLPVEEAVPKSVSIIGTNKSKKAINLMVFVSYGVSVSIDVLTGTRV